MEAVKTCAALLVPMLQQVGLLGAPYPVLSTASNQVVSDVLTQLLTVGITDQGEPPVEWCQDAHLVAGQTGERGACVAHCSLKACCTVSVLSLPSLHPCCLHPPLTAFHPSLHSRG